LRVEDFGSIHLRGGDTLAETGDFTDLLEEDYLARSITVDANAGGIVTTIFLTGETVAEDITNLLAILGLEIATVAKIPHMMKRKKLRGVEFG